MGTLTPNALGSSSTPALLGAPNAKRFIKSLFCLEDLAHDDDFVSVLEVPLGYVKWDPAVGSTISFTSGV
ncbi:uncharacterized protein BJ212DRAFT_1343533 [Suillus subaureus]|uniref:Uncharacterized protein n=1 Tax=Suillus subaureus TaxID=48587 RepID=A0A9P7JFG3_9AGAM|nr:uncharacterized protein BJ212DRAFT_1343533 [Suillus subaureus]KAG1819861.1 hypothetical protein BJ212DRAFT_1343533 [Suillus subaureus]